jgi:hypothetical protein
VLLRAVLVYGDLCLGPNGEMRKFAQESSVVKVDAVNCIDCILGGEGEFLDCDPDHNLLFLGPGMTEFFKHFKENCGKNTSMKMTKRIFSVG